MLFVAQALCVTVCILFTYFRHGKTYFVGKLTLKYFDWCKYERKQTVKLCDIVARLLHGFLPLRFDILSTLMRLVLSTFYAENNYIVEHIQGTQSQVLNTYSFIWK